MKKLICVMIAFVVAEPLFAQDYSSQEIMVTAQRIEQDDYSDFQPAVGLRRSADFLVQAVTIRGDTRDADQREIEIRKMLTGAVKVASNRGVELAQGDFIITRLTLENVEELELVSDRRPDSERVDFLVKASLSGRTVKQAQEVIRDFIKAVPENGRAQMDEMGDASLSVVGPDSYRDQIIAAVSEDAKRQAAIVGSDYAVELTGLNMPVQWTRAGPGEVLLFIPYELKVVPKP